MKLIISSAELLKGVLSVSKAIPSKSALPILENFLFDLKGSSLEITASDMELTLRTVLEVDNAVEEGKIAIPAKHITDLLKELPDQPLTISTVSDSSFECRWATGSSTLPFFPAEDYPEISGTDETAVKVTFPAEELVNGISGTIYATADDEIRPVMNGIFFDMGPEGTTLVASDSHKLICYNAPDVRTEEKSSFILHKRPAAVLRSIIGKDTENAEITFDQKNAVFTFGKTVVVCRLIVGKYPKYRDVIPQNNSNVLKIDRALFLNTVRRVSVCANKASNHIKFDLSADSLEISAQDLGFSIAAYEKIPCQYNGDELSIGFKSTFIIEILSNMSCGEIVMKFADSKRAALIVPAEEETDSDRTCGIIMPIMF
ncbi:MAG: DNA polymerase III subunit beta [Bacteroidetes bacterium]|uniref:Beta sliding clamp n=1 Tax=Candidatus Cryptobacteroides gallistercoris TaxID=2840765 RepID=A0A940DNV5_9BACT|nr:DNA polymerase III subunit beta [Candidatus Cryptobacteroides gallistercoris]